MSFVAIPSIKPDTLPSVSLGRPARPFVSLNTVQLSHRDSIQAAIESGVLRMEESVCFCGEMRGLAVAQYDCWGFHIPTIFCARCYTLRSRFFFDEDSMKKFYSGGYYHAHMFTSETAASGLGMGEVDYRREEEEKGENLYGWLARHADLGSVRSVLDVGCGAGGVLAAFRKRGHLVHGCDYVADYIASARRAMPDADWRVGGLEQFAAEEKFDLVILADVVEHLREPLAVLRDLRRFLHEKSLVFIVVPGVFGISNIRFRCSFRYFAKIEHTWCHTRQSLTALMARAGYDFMTGNQGVFSLYQPRQSGDAPAPSPSIAYASFLLFFLASLPIRRFLQIDRVLYAGVRAMRRFSLRR